MQATNLYQQAVEQDFADVNKTIVSNLSSAVPIVEQISQYLIDSGGKRLRPILTLLAAKANGYQGCQHITLAVAIEFIHTATLLHDDVVDHSASRRGRQTANNKWDNASAILVGDFLYSRAFQILVSMDHMPIMDILSKATNLIAEGEVFQLLHTRNPDMTEDDYLQVIMGKTAMLFEAATHTGAQLANACHDQVKSMCDFGRHLGLAFQLVDDLIDYIGDPSIMGKHVGNDLSEGKPTLPLIHAMRVGTDEQRQLIRTAIRRSSAAEIQVIGDIIQTCGSIDYTFAMATAEANHALNCLTRIPKSPYRDGLEELCNLALRRYH
jgi:octaprenyl-diphosphate synthase